MSIVIVVTAVAAALYRRSTRPVEAAQSAALQRMAGVAYQAFQNMRTVRSFAGGWCGTASAGVVDAAELHGGQMRARQQGSHYW